MRKSHQTRVVKINSELLNNWIAVAITSETEERLGLTLKGSPSLITAEKANLLVEESIRRKWNDVWEKQKIEFKIKTD